jgi:hypothetical protein
MMNSVRLADVDIAPYEGLIHSTAVRYVGFLDDDLDDIKQLLRIKVAQALVAFDPTRGEKPTENFVFSCVAATPPSPVSLAA